MFIYETATQDLSLAGVWVEYNPLSSASEVTTKVNSMKGEYNRYGFIANTVGAQILDSIPIQKYINNLTANEVETELKDIFVSPTNINRTVLKIVNANQKEPIKAKATFNKAEVMINIDVIYNTNTITRIIDEYGEIVSENTLDTIKIEALGNGTYEYIVIDNLGNLKSITVKVEGLNTYIIPNLNMLKKFRDEVNSGNTFAGVTVLQTADIAMNEGKYTIDEETGDITFDSDAEQWTPIGNVNRKFSGSYDGGNHTISGIYINNDKTNQGLFGYCYNATLQNINVKQSEIISTKSNVGGIVGQGYAKGSYNLNITNCHSSGKIKGSGYVGGIVGYISKNDKNQNFYIKQCSNSGEIYGSASYVGGIAGSVHTVDYSSYPDSIEGCYNTGKIKSNANYVGGIVGEEDGISVTKCYNLNQVYGKEYIGGICGASQGDADSTIKNCYNTGEIYRKYRLCRRNSR